jgi:hypothetical protein
VRETLAKEQFIDSLIDGDMRLRIKQARPINLNDAIRHAVELQTRVPSPHNHSMSHLLWDKTGQCVQAFHKHDIVLNETSGSVGVHKLAPEAGMFIKAKVNGVNTNLLIDTGATVTLISTSFFKDMHMSISTC